MHSLEEALASLEHFPSVENFTRILHKCRKTKSLACAQRLYAHMCKSRLEAHGLLGNHLVPMLVEVGSVCDAQEVFNRLVHRNEYSWTSLITGYMECGEPQHALSLYQKMQEDSVHPSGYTFIALLKACARLKDVERGQDIHSEIVRKGWETDLFVGNTLINMYSKCGSLAKAREVFDKLPVRDAVSWNALIVGYSDHGFGEEALHRFDQMVLEGIPPNALTFVSSLKACSSTGAVDKGHEIHVEIARNGFLESDLFVGNALIDMYAKCGLLAKAEEVFHRLPIRDAVSWNVLITGYAENGFGGKVLDCLEQMRLDGVSPNVVTFICSLKACVSTGFIDKGREIHAEIARKGLMEGELVIGNALVDMYAKCGSLAEAQEVFKRLPVRDVVSWTALIAAHAEHGLGEEALNYFEQMQLEGIGPNAFTFVCSLKACGSIRYTEKGQEIHAEIVRLGLLDSDPCVGNSLVDMYIKCGLLAQAQEVFDKLPSRDVVSWTALIAGYVEHGLGEEALNCLESLQLEGVSPDAFTLVCSLKACGSVGATDKGSAIHTEIARRGLLELDPCVGNALVSMYAKFGWFAKAWEVFDNLPVRNVVSWNALIAGYAEHGLGEEALNCLSCMQQEGVSPDALTSVCSLKACGGIGAIDKGREIHAEIAREGLWEIDFFVGNALVDMYAQCGCLVKAREVFDKLQGQNAISWNTLIAGYAKHGLGEEALNCFEQMQLEGVSSDDLTFVCSLKACGSIRDIDKGQQIHEEISRKGLLEREPFVGNALVDMYAKCGLLDKAQEVFDKLPVRDVVSWTALIAAYAECGLGDEALNCFDQMILEGVSPNAATFVCILKACGSIGAIDRGREMHANISRKGFLESDPFVGSSLVDMYAKCGSLAIAEEVFHKLPVRDAVSWNVMITGYAEHGFWEKVLNCFEQMQLDGISPNAVTYVCGLKACISTGAIEKGQEIHGEIARKGLLEREPVVGNALVALYAKCGSLAKAWEVFDKLPVRDVVSWTVLIATYVEHGHGEEALSCFEWMQMEGVSPNTVTFICSMKACGCIRAKDVGQQIHFQLVRLRLLERDPCVGNALVDMYAKCGLLAKAQQVFDELLVRDVVSWTALIEGYAKHGLSEEALDCFEQMQLEGVSPDSFTYVCTLKACGSIGAMDKGRYIHAEIARKGLLERDPCVGSALVDMYAKCGSITSARKVFDKLLVRDVFSWNAVIAGYAHIGESDNVFHMLERMREDIIKPSGATFLSVFAACSHTGLVDKGQKYFEVMSKDYGIAPTSVHHTCMVDLLGRAGQLDEAVEVMNQMPFHPDPVAWHTVLGACRKWGNVKLAREAFECAVQLDEKDAAAYVLMSNIYADAHMQEVEVNLGKF